MGNKHLKIWSAEEQHEADTQHLGWDFTHLDGRMVEEAHPWSYPELAKDLLDQSTAVIDMNTAEGGRFLKLKYHWPAKVVVTEEYRPNYLLAKQNLEPHGVSVFDVRLTHTDPMPFEDGEFDLVLNRHSAFNANEVGRILAKGGMFLTQQVHGLWMEDLMAVFGIKPQWPDSTPENYVKRLEAAGLKIDTVKDWQGAVTFTDVGAIVYYLRRVPWTVPGFSVESHTEQLLHLQEQLESGRTLTFSAKKFLLKASNPS